MGFLKSVKEGIGEGLSSAATNWIYKEGYQDGLNGNHRNMSLCKNKCKGQRSEMSYSQGYDDGRNERLIRMMEK